MSSIQSLPPNTVACFKCQHPLRYGDDFCESCGFKVTEGIKQLLRSKVERASNQAALGSKGVQSASGTIIVLAALFVLSGGVTYAIQNSAANDALATLQKSGRKDDETFSEAIDGKRYTIGELRAEIKAEPRQVLIVNLVLAAIMVALWFWSKRAPLAAIVSALAVYAVVVGTNAAIDPKTLAQGIVVKIIVIAALVKGLREALAARSIATTR